MNNNINTQKISFKLEKFSLADLAGTAEKINKDNYKFYMLYISAIEELGEKVTKEKISPYDMRLLNAMRFKILSSMQQEIYIQEPARPEKKKWTPDEEECLWNFVIERKHMRQGQKWTEISKKLNVDSLECSLHYKNVLRPKMNDFLEKIPSSFNNTDWPYTHHQMRI